MKRSNLFLSLTTGCLAVASFAFAKSHNFGQTNQKCVTKVGVAAQCNSNTLIAVTTINGSGRGVKATCHGVNLHKTVRTANCVKTLYTKAGV